MAKIQIAIILTFLILIVIIPRARSENVDLANINKQISSFLINGDCKSAADLAGQVYARNNMAEYLPDWWKGIIQCRLKKGKDAYDFPMLIDEYYERLIQSPLKNNDCTEAEIIIDLSASKRNNIKNRDLILKVAKCYEPIQKLKSVELYQEIIDRTAKGKEVDMEDPLAVQAQQRINWLDGKRDWVYSDPMVLINGVKNAIQNKDSLALIGMASKSSFRWAYAGGQYEPMLLNEKNRGFFQKKLDNSKVIIKKVIVKDGYYDLPTEGWDGEYHFVHFRFEKNQFGWEWTWWLNARNESFFMDK